MADAGLVGEQKTVVERARKVLPGGTFGNMPGEVVLREGKGGRVWDVDGNEYVDYLLGSGPMYVGHCHPDVVAAVQAQIQRGSTFFANNENGIRLAEEIVAGVPCAEKVRFFSSGTEADLYAMRVARAYRKRDKILKFEGGYHGMSDYGLMSLAPKRPGNFPQPVPDSAGIPRSIRDEMLVAPYNDADMAASLIAEHKDDLAGVIVEPFQRLIRPQPGFLQALREMTAKHDIPLIFDEVVTGFRLAYGGGQEYYGVTPDLCSLGKIIGGGYPLAAIAGRADIMAHFDKGAVGEEGFLTHIGTLSGNPVAAAAGLATLEILRRPGAYEKVFATGRTLMDGMAAAMREAGLPGQIIGEPVCFDALFADGDVREYRATTKGDPVIQQAFNKGLRKRGVFKSDSKMYISLAHDARDVAQTLVAFREAAAEAAAARSTR